VPVPCAGAGTDATTDTTLEGMGKPFRWAEVQQTNRLLVQTQIACAHFVIFGGPGETPATVQEGLDNIAARPLRRPRFPVESIPSLCIGAPSQASCAGDRFSSILSIMSRQWTRLGWAQVSESWAGRRDRIFPPHEGQRTAAVLRAFGWKGLLWDRMIRFSSSVV
jgi:hypothetical protein